MTAPRSSAPPLPVTRTGAGFYRYSPAAPILNGVAPLCWPGRDEEVGAAIGAALAVAEPTPDVVSIGSMAVASSCQGDQGRLAQTAAHVDRRT